HRAGPVLPRPGPRVTGHGHRRRVHHGRYAEAAGRRRPHPVLIVVQPRGVDVTSTHATLEPGVEDAGARQARLSRAVARLRSRSGSGSLDRWLLVVGGTLAPLG